MSYDNAITVHNQITLTCGLLWCGINIDIAAIAPS